MQASQGVRAACLPPLTARCVCHDSFFKVIAGLCSLGDAPTAHLLYRRHTLALVLDFLVGDPDGPDAESDCDVAVDDGRLPGVRVLTITVSSVVLALPCPDHTHSRHADRPCVPHCAHSPARPPAYSCAGPLAQAQCVERARRCDSDGT